MITRATTATLDDLDDESDVSVLLVNEENKHFGIVKVAFELVMELLMCYVLGERSVEDMTEHNMQTTVSCVTTEYYDQILIQLQCLPCRLYPSQPTHSGVCATRP